MYKEFIKKNKDRRRDRKILKRIAKEEGRKNRARIWGNLKEDMEKGFMWCIEALIVLVPFLILIFVFDV